MDYPKRGYKPSWGAERLVASMKNHDNHEFDWDRRYFCNLVEQETGAERMAEAIEKLLDYDRRNGAINFQYEKWLDHLYNLKVAVDNYRNGTEAE